VCGPEKSLPGCSHSLPGKRDETSKIGALKDIVGRLLATRVSKRQKLAVCNGALAPGVMAG